jgi:Kringle domain
MYTVAWTGLTGQENFGTECLLTTDGAEYVGSVNTTLTGHSCQAWSSQSPQVHSYDDLSFFPDKVTSVNDVRNYCRNLRLPSLDGRPWCMPIDYDDEVTTEFCDIPVCKGNHGCFIILKMGILTNRFLLLLFCCNTSYTNSPLQKDRCIF